MDPRLTELYESGSADDEVAVIMRLAKGAEPPANVRVVSRFGEIATARVRRGDIVTIRHDPAVFSLKAGRYVAPPSPFEGARPDAAAYEEEIEADAEAVAAASAPGGARLSPVAEDGRGVVVGICDWGFDFTHANFRNPDGTTRLLALWDQRGFGDPLAPAPYNQGRRLTRSAINAALAELDPCAALGYHPASGDPTDTGSHGTHVADILAGNRREPGSEVGLASGSDIVFVHLAAPNLSELSNLGDSVGLLEGLDFVRREAAGRPCVLHLSAGKTGGPHRGTTLLERAVDTMLQEPSIVLVQSVGNYADAAMHAHARVGPDQRYSLDWDTPADDRTPNELEIWYSGQDVFDITLVSPDGREFSTPLDSRVQVRDGPTLWGNFYHRLHEPNSGLNHVCVFLYTAAPSGRWRLKLHGRDVVDGRLHAWIERDASGRYQSRFLRSQASPRYTTNTICNCFRAIAVGAYDATRPHRPATRFSSRGPTADGRQKPEIAAPGYRIRAARSMPRDGWHGERRLCVKSGTSMAAPWVSGTVALMMAAAGRPLTIHEIRRALIGTADPHPGPSGRTSTQIGYGYLNTAAAVEAARRIGRGETGPRLPVAPPTEQEEPEERGFPPVWVEDAAAAEVEETLASGEDCGCGRRETTAAAEGGEQGEDDDSEDDGPAEEPLAVPDEWIETPFAWEDIQAALEAVDEGEA
jgi:subtilisin family serine protease